MKLHELEKNIGAKQRRKIVGRGPGSGLGKTSGKGQKGQNSRSGGGVNPVFEGGQLPLYRRLPKRGFSNIFEEGTLVTPALLKEVGLVKKQLDGIKVLGNGEINKKLTVQAHKFSKSAIEKLEESGSKIEVI